MTHQKTCIYTGPPPHLPKALRRQESTELVKRDLFLHRSQEGFGSHQEPKGQYRRGGFWVWTQETSTGSVCAGDTFIFLDSYFVHPCLSFSSNSETSGLFPITDSSPNSQLEAQPTIQREQSDPGADKGALFPPALCRNPPTSQLGSS